MSEWYAWNHYYYFIFFENQFEIEIRFLSIKYSAQCCQLVTTHHPVHPAVNGNSNAFSAYKAHCLWILHWGNVFTYFVHSQLADEVKMSGVEFLLYIVRSKFRTLNTGSVPPNNNEIETIKLKRSKMCARIVFHVGFSAFSVCPQSNTGNTHSEKKILPEKSVIQFQYLLVFVLYTIQGSGIQFRCNVNLLYSSIRYFFSVAFSLAFDGILLFRPIPHETNATRAVCKPFRQRQQKKIRTICIFRSVNNNSSVAAHLHGKCPLSTDEKKKNCAPTAFWWYSLHHRRYDVTLNEQNKRIDPMNATQKAMCSA